MAQIQRPLARPVLIVEDDPNIRESLAELLREHGHVVITAEHGAEAIEHLGTLNGPPAVILLDLMMPVMNGWQFLEHREKDVHIKEVPVVIMTVALDASAGLPNISGYLRKPFVEGQLLELVDRVAAGAEPPPVAPKAASTTGPILHVLLIEEDAIEAETTRAQLAEARGFRFEVQQARSLAEAGDALAGIDVILLDIGSTDIGAIERALRQAHGIPLVVLAGPGTSAGKLRDAAIRKGAQDSIDKDSRSPALLARALHYAVERQRLSAELEQTREVAAHERERKGLERWAKPRSSVAAEMLGHTPLKRSSPDLFAGFLREFDAICNQAVAELSHDREASQLKQLHGLAGALAEARVGPGDIVDLYQEALGAWTDERTEVASARREEARLMLIGLLGYVLAAYRLHALEPK